MRVSKSYEQSQFGPPTFLADARAPVLALLIPRGALPSTGVATVTQMGQSRSGSCLLRDAPMDVRWMYVGAARPVGVSVLKFSFGSGTEIRTPNLAVNRSLQPVQKPRSEFVRCRRTPPDITVYHRCCGTNALLGIG